MITPYDRINEFCESRSASKLQERILLYKYYKDYQEIADNYRKANNVEPTDQLKLGWENAFLSDTALDGNMRLAQEEIKEELSNQINKYKRSVSLKNFCMNVLSGIIASFLFAWLLVAILSLAQDQVRGWINNLYATNKQIEQSIDDK